MMLLIVIQYLFTGLRCKRFPRAFHSKSWHCLHRFLYRTEFETSIRCRGVDTCERKPLNSEFKCHVYRKRFLKHVPTVSSVNCLLRIEISQPALPQPQYTLQHSSAIYDTHSPAPSMLHTPWRHLPYTLPRCLPSAVLILTPS